MVDCACSSTCSGEIWIDAYYDVLSPAEKAMIVSTPCTRKYRFGDGSEMQAIKTVQVPVLIGRTKASLTIDVVPADIPLLLSVQSLTRGDAKISFQAKTMTILNQELPLYETTTGHLLLPLGHSVAANNITSGANDIRDILMNSATDSLDEKSLEKNALKLHRQFAHPPPDRLKRLVKDSGMKDQKILPFIDKVSRECNTCQQLRPSPSRPVVGFPLATDFNEVVAMDLKQLKHGVLILHLIDHATRYSSGCIIKNKRKETIVEGILTHWVKWFGPPKKFLSDNGGEFINDELIDLAEKFNIVIKTTAAESPWSNGLCERHNALIASNIHKVRLDVGCSVEVALAWSLSAKNCLANVQGFSPNQLVFGRNPNLPNVLDNKVPANNVECVSKVLERHLNALHTARQEFVKAEASEKIRRALCRKTRSYSDQVYCSGDMVYYKRLRSDQWHGPAKLLGKDGQVCLLKHGGLYIRVHPCRMSPVFADLQNGKTSGTSSKPIENTEIMVVDGDQELSSPTQDSYDDCDSSSYISSSESSDHGDSSTDSGDEYIPAASRNDTSLSDDSEESVVSEVQTTPPVVEASTSWQGPAVSAKDLPNIKQKIAYKTSAAGESCIGTVHSRGGKVGGIHWHFLNIQPEGSDDVNSLSFRDNVVQWKEVLTSEDQGEISNFVYIGKHVSSSKFAAAKQVELDKWKEMRVYSEVDHCNQDLISTTWVCTEKMKGGSLVCKARLVARGFEEDSSQLSKKSPTCTKDSFRLALSIIASKGWSLQTIDIKSAFLQGEPLSRDVFLHPPKEANTNKIWKLNQAVYGLCDAGRHWYERVKNELLKLDVKMSQLDKSVFYHQVNQECVGIIIVHVDDFLFGGTDYFLTNVISKLHRLFVVGLVESCGMKYLGIDVKQKESTIYMSMDEYIETVMPVAIAPNRSSEKESVLSLHEKQEFKRLSGQINWCASQVRVDVGFSNCQLSNAVNPTVHDLISANKATRQLKSFPLTIAFSPLDCRKLTLCMFSDASFGNLPSGGSQGAYVIFIVDQSGKANVLSWQSRKVRRVCNSTLSAECLAAVDCLKAGILLKHLINELLCCDISDSRLIVDNKSLVQAVNSVTPIEDKRLRIEMAILQESLARKEFSNISLVPSKNNVANALTKQGASCQILLEALSANMRFDFSVNYFV